MTGFAPDLLRGKTILVTGASSGIGRAVAGHVARTGGRVIATGRDITRLEAALRELPGEHAAEAMVLKDADEVADWCRASAARHGGFDGMFHSAGIELVRPVRLTRSAQLQEVFASSLHAGFGLARAAASKDVMRESGGSLVFMSSVAARRGQAGMTAYAAAKGAIDALVPSLACELAPKRIRVNSIAAGAVRTAMHDRLTGTLGEGSEAEYASRHLLGFGEAQDVAGAALYLLSDLARWVTGATWVVDGGYSAR
jgi:NAD(P)-dependent dehydrogenase (short-subunit alcohol dehydrogenase family)